MTDNSSPLTDSMYAYALTRTLEDDFDPDYVAEFMLR